MAEFTWEARARTGELRKGIMEAENADAVNTRLKAQNLSPVKVKKKAREINLSIGSPVSPKELAIFVRQFATMIDAGLPLVQCLDILAGQGANRAFNAILKDVKGSVEQGATFSDSLRRHPKVFDDLFCNLVQAGEIGGILDTILNRLAVYIEKRVKLARQVRGAMVYPAGVMCIAGAVMFVLMKWVIPSFKDMFKDFGSEDGLPALTQLVITISDHFVANVPYMIIGGIAGFATFTYTYRTKGGKRFFHKALIVFPIIGPVMRKIAVARFTRTLGTLLSSGVPILDALNIVARASGNVIVESGIQYAADRIREGRTMAEPLADEIFPQMVVQMIGVGEQTGALDQMLNKIADFYEEEVDVAVESMTSLLEPLMMVVIGGMVGFMLIAMYMPIFDIASKIKAE